LWIGWPWGIDSVERIAVRNVRQLSAGFDGENGGAFLTGDQNLVVARIVLDYAIDESDAGLDDYSANAAIAEAVLAREAESLAAEWIAARPVDDVLLTGRSGLPRWLAEQLPARLARHRLGVVVQRAGIDPLAAPPEVRDAFDAVNRAQAGIAARESAAKREAGQRMQQAATIKYDLEQQATAYTISKLSEANAEAESFRKRLEQFRTAKATNPDALAAIWWEEMGRTLLGMRSRSRVDLLDAHLGKDGLDITQFPSKPKP
jgi:membrane protease subunit HflK